MFRVVLKNAIFIGLADKFMQLLDSTFVGVSNLVRLLHKSVKGETFITLFVVIICPRSYFKSTIYKLMK